MLVIIETIKQKRRDMWNMGHSYERRQINASFLLEYLGCGCMDWMELAQDWDRWRALMTAVMNLRVP